MRDRRLEAASGSSSGELAFFLQSRDDNELLRHSLSSLRRHLPHAPVFLVGDGGTDFGAPGGIGDTFNVETYLAPFAMHLADYLPPHNFTCTGHLERVALAARYGRRHGAKYLIHWEEDTRMLGAPRHIPSEGDLNVMANRRMCHAGGFRPDQIRHGLAIAAGEAQPANAKDRWYASEVGRFEAARYYSAGPLTAYRIDSLLESWEEVQRAGTGRFLGAVQDICWHQLSMLHGDRTEPWREAQQGSEGSVAAYDPVPAELPLECDWDKGLQPSSDLLDCFDCLEACKRRCDCAPEPPFELWGGIDRAAKRLAARLAPRAIAQAALRALQTEVLSRSCEPPCVQGDACWGGCAAGCYLDRCPAMLHHHKGTTFDCFDQPLPR